MEHTFRVMSNPRDLRKVKIGADFCENCGAKDDIENAVFYVS